MRRFRIFVALLTLFAVFSTAAVTLQHRGLANVRRNPAFIDTWNLSGRSGDLLKLLSLRYDLVVGDFLWLRAIQSFGGRGMTNRDWRPLYNLFDTITELDPQFEEAYTFGNMVIGDEGGKQREALGLLTKGMFKMPGKYRTPFEGMYVAHWQLKDTNLARWYGRVASKRADAPDWVPRVTAYLEVESGAYYIGFDRFVGNLIDGMDAGEPALVEIALNKLKETLERWNLSVMLQAKDEFTSRTGKLPSKIEDLATMPALQNYEIASMSRLIAAIATHTERNNLPGLTADQLRETALPSGVELSRSAQTTASKTKGKLKDLQNVIFQESLGKRSGIPEDPYGTRYVLNQTLMGYPFADRDTAIANEPQMRRFVNAMLASVREVLMQRKNELGRWPTSLQETFYTDFNTTEPYGGKWTYDPANGEFKSSTFPNL